MCDLFLLLQVRAGAHDVVNGSSSHPLMNLPTWDILSALSIGSPVRSDRIHPERETLFYFPGLPGICGVEFPEVCHPVESRI